MSNFDEQYALLQILIKETNVELDLLRLPAGASEEYIENETLQLEYRKRLLQDICACLADYDDLSS